MSYRLVVLRDLPLAYWRLENITDSTVIDQAGFGFDGNVTGSPTPGQFGLVAGSKSARFDGTEHFTANLPDILMRGTESQSFSMEAWVKAVAPPVDTRMIMGRGANGVYITPRGVEYRITNTTGTTYTALHTVTNWDKPLHIIANYIGNSLGLIVNLTEGANAEFFGEFSTLTPPFRVGGNTDTPASAVIDEVAVYRFPLDITSATRHYNAARLAEHPADIAQISGGTYYGFDDANSDVAWRYLDNEISLLEGPVVSDLLYIGDLGSTVGSRIDWEASEGISVEVSLDDGETWTVCENHKQIPGVDANADLSNVFMLIRKTPDQNLEYLPRFDNLSVVIYRSKVATANFADSVAVYGNITLAKEAYRPVENREDMGATFADGSYMIVPSGEGGTRSIELWVRRNETSTEPEYIVDTRVDEEGAFFGFDDSNEVYTEGFSAIYVNGAPGNPTSLPDGWNHLVLVLPETIDNSIYLNSRHTRESQGNISIAHLTLSPLAFTDREVGVRYNTALGLVNTSVLEVSVPTIIEHTDGVIAYAASWSNTQSGST